MKIISLVPSISELLVDLKLENDLIGVTKFCVHPNYLIDNKEIIGGTKTLDLKKIQSLNADLIIANKEENQKEQIEELQKHENVWVTDIRNLEDNLKFIEEIGTRCNCTKASNGLIHQIKTEWQSVSNLFSGERVLYFIWRRPYMTIGENTFITSILTELGFEVISKSLDGNYPEISPNWISQQNLDYILLSSEPYAFQEKHKSEFKTMNKHCVIQLIDGEMCSWYGSRMLLAPKYFLQFKQAMTS